MKLYFIGADHEVTGSCHVLEAGGKYIVLDYGMEQGKDLYVNQPLPVPAAQIQAVLLSHAHIDHSGMLPKLVQEGFTGPIYATGATADLCQVMLQDSAHIQEQETEWKNKKNKRAGRPEETPVYTIQDAQKACKQFVPKEYGESFTVLPGVTAHFEDMGHMLGSASIHLRVEEGGVTKTLVFSGDVGNHDQPIIKDPTPLQDRDYVIMESTYGDRLHEKVEDAASELTRIMQDTFSRGGNVIIPCFAVGRTQEILYLIRRILREKRMRVPDDFEVWVDSPLAVEATQIFARDYLGYYDDEAMKLIRKGENPLQFPELHTSVTTEESQLLNTYQSHKVILSASGMCEAGRIRHHLKHNLWRPECTVVFCGYQAEGSLGRRILDGADEVTLFGEKISVQAKIEQLDNVSAHADRDGLLNWLGTMPDRPKQVFIVHGDDAVCTSFARTLQDRQYAADAPYSGAVYDLAAAQWLSQGSAEKIPPRTETVLQQSSPVQKTAAEKQKKEKQPRAYQQLLDSLQALQQLVEKFRGRSERNQKKLKGDIEDLIRKWED